MIRLNRTEKPIELTEELALTLTERFHGDKSARVWNLNFIKDRLLTMSHGKCAYCEANIREESKYMEVDHFECKYSHPNKVVDWSNLLPSCKRCNIQKGRYDVISAPMIIDPASMEPSEHICMGENYRFKAKTAIGATTIDEIYLNDTDRLVTKRFKIGNQIIESLEKIHTDYINLMTNPADRRAQNKVNRSLLKLLAEAQPTYEYSATAATCILRDRNYNTIKDGLSLINLWSSELEQLHAVAIKSSLNCR